MLRYRLYDIDVVINRTLVYAALTATLAAVYLGSVLVLQLALSRSPRVRDWPSLLRRLPVAALFRPPVPASRRRSTGDSSDRSTTPRGRSTGSHHMRDQVDLTDIGTDLLAVVGETVQPTHASLWLRAQEAER